MASGAEMGDHFENIPLESSTVEECNDEKSEADKTSVIKNTLMEFASEITKDFTEDFFINSRESYGPFQGYNSSSHANWKSNALLDTCSRITPASDHFQSSSDGDSTPTPSPRGSKECVSRRDDSFESVESIDLSSETSYSSAATNLDRHRSDGRDERSSSVCSADRPSKTDSVVEELLSDIYDNKLMSSVESDYCDVYCNPRSSLDALRMRKYTKAELMSKPKHELKSIIKELNHRIQQTNSRLMRQLKVRSRKQAQISNNCDIVTACLQAKSLKREVDAKMKFSLEPLPGEENFHQWQDAIRAANRMSGGVPNYIRKRVWLSLAENYMKELDIDWKEVKRTAFNERTNPDDNELGIQIVKDLHRTGCSTFSGLDNDQQRAVLKRVLLAYARWNKEIGYCQGFNIIAAVILDVVGKKEEDALKIMIFLIDKVLPKSYFSNNLRALSVDMAVFRDLMSMYLPKLATHLQDLQIKAQQDIASGGYEPPLTNVFTMQWFLSLFATCLPISAVLRVWDAILLEGSEIIIRTALVLWGILQKKLIKNADTADDFYTLMGTLLQRIIQKNNDVVVVDDLLKVVYSFAPFPFPQLSELREKYTYNITPIITKDSDRAEKRKSSRKKHMSEVVFGNEQTDDMETMHFIAQIVDAEGSSKSVLDIAAVGPGVYGGHSEHPQDNNAPPGVSSEGGIAMAERTSTDISKLQKKYDIIKRRQSQARIMFQTTKTTYNLRKLRKNITNLVLPPAPTITDSKRLTTIAQNSVNHLYVKTADTGISHKNSHVVPVGAPLFPCRSEQGKVQFKASSLHLSKDLERKESTGSSSPLSDNTITFSENEYDEKKTTIDEDDNNNNNNDSKTLLELHLEWRGKQKENQIKSSRPKERSSRKVTFSTHTIPKNPLTPPSLYPGLGTYTTENIPRTDSTKQKEENVSPNSVNVLSQEKGSENVMIETKPPKKTMLLSPYYMRKERRDFGIKLGLYKPSHFSSKKAASVNLSSSAAEDTPRITRQQINSCLARESMAYETFVTHKKPNL